MTCSPAHKLCFVVAQFLWLALLLSAFSGQATAQRSCHVTRKQLEDAVERFRRNVTPVIDFRRELTECRAGLPVLREYVVDPSNEVRGLIVAYMTSSPVFQYKHRRELLEMLIRQIEKYPINSDALTHIYVNSCADIRRVRAKKLTWALTERVRARSDDVNDYELFVLGCLAPKDQKARQFLTEVRQPSFQTRLDEPLRERQLFSVNLALGGVGRTEAVRDAVAHIDQVDKLGRFDELKSVLEDARKTSNVDILLRLSGFIRDKRSELTIPSGIRIGDVAAGVFTRKLGSTVTGDKVTEDWRDLTDEELEAIYHRVKSYLVRHSPALK